MQTANANQCEDGLPLSLTAPTTPRPQKLLVAAPLDNGTVVHKSEASHWTDQVYQAIVSSKPLLCKGLAFTRLPGAVFRAAVSPLCVTGPATCELRQAEVRRSSDTIRNMFRFLRLGPTDLSSSALRLTRSSLRPFSFDTCELFRYHDFGCWATPEGGGT